MNFQPEKLRRKVLQHIREVDGELAFDAHGLSFVSASIEVGAHIKSDAHAKAVLDELPRIAVGLESNAPKAATQLKQELQASKVALLRLIGLAKAKKEKFKAFSGAEKRALPLKSPKTDGLRLQDLLPKRPISAR